MTAGSKCWISLSFFFFQRKVSEQNLSDIGFMSLLLSCQTDMAFWQNLLPQVLHSLRTSREHGISLFPIFWATNRNTTKKKLWRAAKKPIVNVTLLQQLPLLQLCVHQAGPEFRGAFPAVWTAIFIAMFSTPTLPTHGSPLFWHWTKTVLFGCCFLFFFLNHYQTWTNLKREAFTESQDSVKVHMEPLDSVLDFRGLILTEVICESPVSWPSDTIAVCWDRKHGISHTFIPWH